MTELRFLRAVGGFSCVKALSVSLDNIQLDIVVTLQGSQNIRNAVQALDRVSRATNGVRDSSNRLQPVTLNEAKTWDGLTQALSRVETRYDAVFRAGAHMSMMGRGLIDSADQIARATLGIVGAYEGYDTMLRRGAVALNVNEEWQERLDEAIQKTAVTIGGLSPEEIAEGYYIWGAAAGMVVDTQEELSTISEIVEDTMIATAMAGGTLEGNLNGVFGVISQFNLPMSSASDVVKTLGLMTERTAAQFPDLISSMSYIGPLAESLGITFEDVTSILGVLADAGQKGSRAGRGLSMVIEGMSAPSGPAGDALDGLIQRTHGLSAAWGDVIFPEGEFIGMRDMLIEMAKAADGMTDAERGRFYATAFTNNATRALIPLIEDQIDLNREAAASGREYTSVLDEQKYATDGAAEFFETMRDKFLGSITSIRTRLENSFFPIIQAIATNIMEMALPVIDVVGEMALKFADWLKANPELVQMAVRIAGITAVAMAGAGILFSLGGAIMYLIGNLGVFFQGIGRILGPFGLLIGLFVGFGVAIWNNVGGIKDAIKNFADAAAELFTAIVGDGEGFRAAWEGVWNGIRDAVDWVVTQVAEVLNTMADAMRELAKNKEFTAFMQEAITIFLQFRGTIMTLFMAGAALWAAGRALSFFIGMLKILTGYTMIAGTIRSIAMAFSILKMAFAGTTLLGGLSAFIQIMTAGQIALSPMILLIGGIALAVGLLIAAFAFNWFGIRDIVEGVVDWFVNTAFPAIGEFFSNLVTTVGDAIAAVIDWFAQLPGRIGEFLTMVWEAITGWIGSVVDAIGGFITTVAEAIGTFLADIAENWDYYLGYVLGLLIGFFVKGLITVVEFGVNFITAVVDFLVKLPGRFADWLGQTWTDVSTWFTNFIASVGTWMSDMIEKITEWISKAPGRFMTWLGQVWTDVQEWFGQFITDTADWASDTVDGIVDFFKRLPGRVVNGIRILVGKMKTFLEELPGKIWDAVVGIGTAIIDGVWKGIQDAWQGFWDSVHDFFSGIIDGVKDALGIDSPSKVFAEIGEYMIQGMAVGIKSDQSAKRALSGYANSLIGIAEGTTLGFSAGLDGFAEAGGISVTSDATKSVRIELDLTSSDGSYDDATLEQLKAALTGSDLVRALEHMAEAG